MKKILIVEDEIAYQKLLTDFLTKNDYEVFSALNGLEALDIIEKTIPDLILLDIKMPVLDGHETLNRIRAMDYGKDIDIIILTNLEQDTAIESSISGDLPLDFIVKSDISMDGLLQKIGNRLSKD